MPAGSHSHRAAPSLPEISGPNPITKSSEQDKVDTYARRMCTRAREGDDLSIKNKKKASGGRFLASGGQGLRPCTHFRFWAAPELRVQT